MKNVILFFAFALISINIYAQTETADTIKPGSVLTYHVNAQGQEYDFIVTIKSLSNSITEGSSFDWKMTAPVNISGTINMSADAIDTSYAWYNYFNSGIINLEDQTSVLVSYFLVEDMISAKEEEALLSEIKLNGTDEPGEQFYLKKIDEKYSYKKNGNTITSLNADKIENKDGTKWALINTMDYHPYIVEMNVGFHIKLTSIKF